FQAEDGIRDRYVTGVQTCALPISLPKARGHQSLTERHPFASPASARPSAAIASLSSWARITASVARARSKGSCPAWQNRWPKPRSEERRVGEERRDLCRN